MKTHTIVTENATAFDIGIIDVTGCNYEILIDGKAVRLELRRNNFIVVILEFQPEDTKEFALGLFRRLHKYEVVSFNQPGLTERIYKILKEKN